MAPHKKIFISYAHEDALYKDEIVKHLSILQRQGLVETWTDGAIPPGGEWDRTVRSELETADIILLLISGDFKASDYIWGTELQTAMARHDRGEAVVVPIALRPCEWRGAPYEKLQGLPAGAKPVSTWPNADEAYLSVSRGIRRIIHADAEAPAEKPSFYEKSDHASGPEPLPPIPDLDGGSYDHALRPEFTESVIRTLFVQRHSINLVAPSGAGSDRLVEDIRACRLPDTWVLDVDLKNYVASHRGLLNDLSAQTGVPLDSGSRVAGFLSKVSRQRRQRTLLCLHNFDTLLNDPADLDPDYDVAFLNELNALRNQPDVCLLYKTQTPHNQCRFRGRTSWLTLQLLPLPDLSAAQLEAEIDRRRTLPAGQKIYLVEQLETETMPYTVLQRLFGLLTGENNLSRSLLRDRLKQIHQEVYGYGRR